LSNVCGSFGFFVVLIHILEEKGYILINIILDHTSHRYLKGQAISNFRHCSMPPSRSKPLAPLHSSFSKNDDIIKQEAA
jgi:hypothetical protein